MIYDILLTSAEFEICRNFAKNSSSTQRENRSGGLQIRSYNVIYWDTLRGKVGEMIMKKFLENPPLSVSEIKLDFGVYPRGVWDKYDFSIKGISFSVKAIKHFSKWLLLESKDIERGNLYDIYALVAVNKNICGGRVLGFASKEEILKSPFTIHLAQGDLIPGTSTVLDADNHAIHSRNLRNSAEDWKGLFSR